VRPASGAKIPADLFPIYIPVLGGVTHRGLLFFISVVHATAYRDSGTINTLSIFQFHVINSCTNLSRQKRNGLPLLTAPL
jgi:hypothetical protein